MIKYLNINENKTSQDIDQKTLLLNAKTRNFKFLKNIPHKKLSNKLKKVLAGMLYYGQGEEGAIVCATQEKIAQQAGCSVSTVKRNIPILITVGLVSILTPYNNDVYHPVPNKYVLNIDFLREMAEIGIKIIDDYNKAKKQKRIEEYEANKRNKVFTPSVDNLLINDQKNAEHGIKMIPLYNSYYNTNTVEIEKSVDNSLKFYENFDDTTNMDYEPCDKKDNEHINHTEFEIEEVHSKVIHNFCGKKDEQLTKSTPNPLILGALHTLLTEKEGSHRYRQAQEVLNRYEDNFSNANCTNYTNCNETKTNDEESYLQYQFLA